MKSFVLIFMLLLFSFVLLGQEKQESIPHQISVDFGSYRNDYPYAMTNITYRSPGIKNNTLQFSARLRSYGTWFFFSKTAYDFTPMGEYFFHPEKPVHFSAGIGMDVRLRLNNDERSEATSSAEPLLFGALHGKIKKWTFDLPLWSRYYSNGLSLSLLPQIGYTLGQRANVYIRYEASYLKVYKVDAHEIRHDVFLGLAWAI